MSLCLWVVRSVLRVFAGFWGGSSINFYICPAASPAQCRVKVRVKCRYLRRGAVAFSSLFNFALPTPSPAQSRRATRVPCSRVTWYRAMYGSVCHLLFFYVLYLFYFVFFRLNTFPPSGAVSAATFHLGYLSFLRLTPHHADGPREGFRMTSFLVLAPVFPSISTRARLTLIPFLWLVRRRAFPAPPSPHRRYETGTRAFSAPPPATPAVRSRFLTGSLCLAVGSAFPSTPFLRVFLVP